MQKNTDQVIRMEELSSQVAECTWSRNLLSVAVPIASKHLRDALESKIDYDLLGTNTEKEIKNILYLYDKLITVIMDIEKTLYFISTPPIDNIETNPFLHSTKEFYKYYLENYLIRISSIPDVLAILANDICKWGIAAKRCYGTTIAFNTKEEVVGREVKSAMNDILTKINAIRTKRNEIIHAGDTEIEYFSNIVFWNDFQSKLGLKGEDLLEEWTEAEVKSEVEKMLIEMKDIVTLVVNFLNLLTPKTNHLIEKYKHESAQYESLVLK